MEETAVLKRRSAEMVGGEENIIVGHERQFSSGKEGGINRRRRKVFLEEEVKGKLGEVTWRPL